MSNTTQQKKALTKKMQEPHGGQEQHQNYHQLQQQRKEELKDNYKDLMDSFKQQKEYYRGKKVQLKKEQEERNEKQKSVMCLLSVLGIVGMLGAVVVTKKRSPLNKTSRFNPTHDSKNIHSTALNVAIASLFILSLLLMALPWVYRYYIQDINMKNGYEEWMKKVGIVLLFAGLLSLALTGVVCGFGAFDNSDARTMGVVSAIIFSLAIIYLCASYFSSSKDVSSSRDVSSPLDDSDKSESLEDRIKSTDKKIEMLERKEENVRENLNDLFVKEIELRTTTLQQDYSDYYNKRVHPSVPVSYTATAENKKTEYDDDNNDETSSKTTQ